MAYFNFDEYKCELFFEPFDTMSDAELLSFCISNKTLNIERDERVQLILSPPRFPFISMTNATINGEINVWNRRQGTGVLFDSSAGFFLPDTSMRSPDAAWISWERWNALPDERKKGFAYVTPDFIAELASPSDSINDLKVKMEKWRSNGVNLGWLIDVKNETVFIYRADGTVSKVEGFDKAISGEDVLPGFELDLGILK